MQHTGMTVSDVMASIPDSNAPEALATAAGRMVRSATYHAYCVVHSVSVASQTSIVSTASTRTVVSASQRDVLCYLFSAKHLHGGGHSEAHDRYDADECMGIVVPRGSVSCN